MNRIEFVFFDIGGTLGTVSGNGFVPFPDSVALLRALRDAVGVRIGVITTLGNAFSDAQAIAMLQQAGLAGFLDPRGFVSDHNANGVSKPSPGIYELAARQVGVPIERCLFVGENLTEIVGAQAAGMQGTIRFGVAGT